METMLLNNGIQIPALGFGVFQLSDQAQCELCVRTALETGYRLLDTAPSYQNEAFVGNAIRQSGVPRKDIFVTSKCWIQDAGYDPTLRAFDKSMKELGLDYLDMYLIHRPFGDYYGSWRAMERLYQEGRVRAIGVSNFPVDRLLDLLEFHEVPPAVNQIETHPFFQQAELRTVMDETNIRLMAWGPFAEGTNHIFQNETLSEIGRKYGKSVAQVVLRWHFQRGNIALPRSSNPERIKENFAIWDFALSDDDMARINGLETGMGVFKNKINSPKVIRRWLSAKIHD